MRACPEELDIAANVNADGANSPAEKTRQVIKWTVYSLLVINWGYYILDDWRAAQFTLSTSGSMLDVMNAYATSLDEFAWFGMLFLFEAETYWLSDDELSRLSRFLFVSLRIICYAFLAHTLFAYLSNYAELTEAPLLATVADLCNLGSQDYSFLRNLQYTTIDGSNCGALAAGDSLYRIGGDLVVTDAAGLAEAKYLAAIDIGDAVTWLSVVFVIEMLVLAQEKGISEGPVITACKYINILLYGILFFNAANWLWKGHYVYAWDEILWIGGFAAIEMNLSDWRDDLHGAAASA